MFDSRNRGFRNERIDCIEALAKKQLSVGVHVKLSLESKLDGGEMCVIKAEMSVTCPQTTNRLSANYIIVYI